MECYNSNILKIGADSEKIKSVSFLFGGEFLKNLQIIPIISYGKYSKLFLNYLRDRNNNQDLQNYLALLRAK